MQHIHRYYCCIQCALHLGAVMALRDPLPNNRRYSFSRANVRHDNVVVHWRIYMHSGSHREE